MTDHTTQILRNLDDNLAALQRRQADAVTQHRAEVDALIAEFQRDADGVPEALVVAVVEAMR